MTTQKQHWIEAARLAAEDVTDRLDDHDSDWVQAEIEDLADLAATLLELHPPATMPSPDKVGNLIADHAVQRYV